MNEVIRAVKHMSRADKEKAATELLKGLEGKHGKFSTMYKQLENVTGKPYNTGAFQKLKPAMFELLVAKFESE